MKSTSTPFSRSLAEAQQRRTKTEQRRAETGPPSARRYTLTQADLDRRDEAVALATVNAVAPMLRQAGEQAGIQTGIAAGAAAILQLQERGLLKNPDES